MRSDLVVDALQMATWRRRPEGTIVHSDRGSQYTSWVFGHRLHDAACSDPWAAWPRQPRNSDQRSSNGSKPDTTHAAGTPAWTCSPQAGFETLHTTANQRCNPPTQRVAESRVRLRVGGGLPVRLRTDGPPIKIVTIVDKHTRECLGGLVERSVTGDDPIGELDRMALTRGYPEVLRCDNGPELARDAMAGWARERVGLAFIPPSRPWRNGYVESFNARLRDECININIFWSLTHARVTITDWKEDYNQRRRHSSLGYQAPAVNAAACTHR